MPNYALKLFDFHFKHKKSKQQDRICLWTFEALAFQLKAHVNFVFLPSACLMLCDP